jgi:hypothetical protein
MNKAKPSMEQSGGYDAGELVFFKVAGRMSCQITQRKSNFEAKWVAISTMFNRIAD